MAERDIFTDNKEVSSSSRSSMENESLVESATSLAAADMSTPNTVDAKRMEDSENGAVGIEGTIDRLLEKQKNELMYELRRLQHGDRPVTGQGNKEAVEQFFHRALGGEGTVPQPEENRPEHVVVEVNALVERRPVSSVLQSSGFRRNLEHALRGALSNISRQPVVRSRQPVSHSSVPMESTDAGSERNSNSGRRETPPPEPTARETLVNALESRRRQIEGRPVPAPRQRPPQPPPLPQVQTAESHNERIENNLSNNFAQEWLRREEQSNFNAGSPVHLWETIEHAQRENLISEISELVHRQLVTSTLTGNFRQRLEASMQERLQASNTDGRRVQEFLRSIPRSDVHIRNDFSELGIQEHLQEALSDEMSVVSATAAVTVPYAQSNAVLSREITSLKAQLQEMKNMMKLQFDMTMDIQRAIRQEVAAAMNHNQGIQIQPTVSSRPVNDTQCLICLDNQVDTVLYQCGHMCVCHGCGMHLRQRGSNCPVCRAPIKDIIRAFKCNSE